MTGSDDDGVKYHTLHLQKKSKRSVNNVRHETSALQKPQQNPANTDIKM